VQQNKDQLQKQREEEKRREEERQRQRQEEEVKRAKEQKAQEVLFLSFVFENIFFLFSKQC
jgi:hypothetical protein